MYLASVRFEGCIFSSDEAAGANHQQGRLSFSHSHIEEIPKGREISVTMNIVMALVQGAGIGVTFVLLNKFTPLPTWAALVLAVPLFLIVFWIVVWLVAGRRKPARTEYKGYIIRCVPNRLADSGDWTHDILIVRDTGGEVRQRQFGSRNRYRTKGEAIQQGFSFGARIIDGKMEECSVADL